MILDDSIVGQNEAKGEYEQEEVRERFQTRVLVLTKSKVLSKKIGSWRKRKRRNGSRAWV